MSQRPICCWICGSPCRLEDCKTDEQGLPVHGDCYVRRVTLKNQDLAPRLESLHKDRLIKEYLRGSVVSYF